MSKQTLQKNAQAIKDLSVPEEINSSTAKLIYVYIKSVSSATIEQLSSSLSMKRITLYPIVSTLQQKGFITKSNNLYQVSN
jgi:DNA-binding MarR family transcriptional regulator